MKKTNIFIVLILIAAIGLGGFVCYEILKSPSKK